VRNPAAMPLIAGVSLINPTKLKEVKAYSFVTPQFVTSPITTGVSLANPTKMVEVGGIEPHTRIVAQRFTPYCDYIVTVFMV
jgi:hypothetical protein